MQIKICGLREKQNILDVISAKPDLIGFVLFPASKRYAGERLESGFFASLPAVPIKTAIFVDENLETVKESVERYGFQAVQLHGTEAASYCRALTTCFAQLNKPIVIKAFGLRDDFNFQGLESYIDCVDFFLFDTSTPLKGGSGKKFNWQLLEAYHLEVPFWLSGGLALNDIDALYKMKERFPRLYGLDFNSKLEISPGLKDVARVKQIVEKIRAWEEK